MKKTLIILLVIAGFMFGSLKKTLATPLITDGLVASYEFIGNANDGSGYANDGTVYGASLTTDRFGNANSAYSFNGVDDYIEIPDSDSLDIPSITNQISISSWLKIENPAGAQYYILDSRGVDGDSPGYGLNVDTDGIQFWVHGWWPTFPSTIQLDEWQFVVGTYDGYEMRMYVNGIMIDNAFSAGGILPSSNTCYIGRSWNNIEHFDGIIDEIAIYDRALTENEISQLYTGANPVPEPATCLLLLFGLVGMAGVKKKFN